MDTKSQVRQIKEYIKNKDIFMVKEIDIDDLIISEKVREYCIKNRCGKYGKNFMCPPFVGSINNFREKLKDYYCGLLVFVKDKIDNSESKNKFYKSADILHKIMLDLENKGREVGFKNCTVLIGGNCRICSTCAAVLGESRCRFPDKARPSLEAVGVDVINTCKKVGIDIEFRKDEVVWVGLLLV